MSNALREVRLYGRLGQQFGRVFRLAVQSPGEAIRALCAVLPGFRTAFLGDDGLARYHVYVGRGPQRAVIDEGRKDDLVGGQAPIRFVPAVGGAKRAGLGQTILGAVLVVVGVAMNVWSEGALAPLGNALIASGIGMMIGGVVQMLSPQRKTEKETTSDPSYGMDAGAVNNGDAGAPVPLAYGRVIAGSVQISGGLSTDEIVPATGAGSIGPVQIPDYMDPDPVDSGAVIVPGWGDRGG